jgi:hypothetical protein
MLLVVICKLARLCWGLAGLIYGARVHGLRWLGSTDRLTYNLLYILSSQDCAGALQALWFPCARAQGVGIA